MPARPLVSIITPTIPERHDLLLGAIGSVRSQTYRPLEHVIVSDGPDPELMDMILENVKTHLGEHERRVGIRPLELGRHWSSFLPDSLCAAPAVVGQLLARGEYQCFWADDERADPDHLTKLVDLLESSGADFVYPYVEMHWKDQPESRWVIGTDPPQCGEITHWLYRADLLKRGLYPFGAGGTSDWACVEQWIKAGATWAMLPEVTFSHRADR